MQRESKIQRLSAAPPPTPEEPVEEPEKRAKTVVELDSSDHMTYSSFADVASTHTYDVVSGEFNLSANDRNGNGYFVVKLNVERLFQKLGIRRVVTDLQATVKSIKLLRAESLRKSESVASEDDAPPSESPAAVPPKLKERVKRELSRLVAYGPSQYVVVYHGKRTKESTGYQISISHNGEALTFQFMSVETDRVTGTVTLSDREVCEAVAQMMNSHEDDDDITTAMKTARTLTKDTFKLSVRKHCGNAVALSVAMPDDSFTAGARCDAHVANLYLTE